jgi:hypothetical protein
MGAFGGRQVGDARVGNAWHAITWTGSAASWVDLNPAGASESGAYGCSAGQQVGYAVIGGVTRASLWAGSAPTWVDLHPPTASASMAWGSGNGQQTGYADINGTRASVWSGSARSWIDLSPPSGGLALWSAGAFGGQQVGITMIGGASVASLWHGSPSTWINLDIGVPAQFSDSAAKSIWSDAGFTYIAGYGVNAATGQNEALLWTRPNCYANCDGSTTPPILNSTDFACFLNHFAAGDAYANCDSSTTPPMLSVLDFTCFLNALAAGCS